MGLWEIGNDGNVQQPHRAPTDGRTIESNGIKIGFSDVGEVLWNCTLS